MERFKNLEGFTLSQSSVNEIYFDNPKIQYINVSDNAELKNLNISQTCAKLDELYIYDSDNLKIDIDELLKLESLKTVRIEEGQLTEKEIKALIDNGVSVDVEDK